MFNGLSCICHDYAPELKAVLAPLAPLGFPVAEWTPATALNYCPSISIKDFIENMKMFNTIQDEMVRDDWLALGIKKGFWTQITSCTFYGMYRFSVFFQSNEAKTLFLDFAKKRVDDETDSAYLSLLNLQLSGLALAKKHKRAELEDEIAELRRLLEKKVDDVDALFLPCSEYQPLDEVTLLERCYEKYLAEASKQGTKVLELDQDLLETLMVKYRVEVRQEHKHEFMRDEERGNMIKVWANEKIFELGKRKEASIFHRLLADT